jgi:hypothetical protein
LWAGISQVENGVAGNFKEFLIREWESTTFPARKESSDTSEISQIIPVNVPSPNSSGNFARNFLPNFQENKILMPTAEEIKKFISGKKIFST